MAKTHWKKLTNPDYLGAYALEDGKDVVYSIKSVGLETVTGPDGKSDSCIVAHFTEPVKPMIVNATNAKMMQKLFKTPFIEDWCGRKVQIGISQVKAFGDVVDALRIRAFLPKEENCTVCGGEVEANEKLNVAQMVAYSQRKYGKVMCANCMIKEKANEELKAKEAAEAK